MRLFLAIVTCVLALGPLSAMAGATASQAQKPCFAEVWYTDQTHGHTYEYRCGAFRLRAGQFVRVWRSNYGRLELATARIVRISAYRTYFGGPLKTVVGVR